MPLLGSSVSKEGGAAQACLEAETSNNLRTKENLWLASRSLLLCTKKVPFRNTPLSPLKTASFRTTHCSKTRSIIYIPLLDKLYEFWYISYITYYNHYDY
jgi:hypothetical protein